MQRAYDNEFGARTCDNTTEHMRSEKKLYRRAKCCQHANTVFLTSSTTCSSGILLDTDRLSVSVSDPGHIL